MGQFLGTQIVVGFDPSLFLPSETIGEHLGGAKISKMPKKSSK